MARSAEIVVEPASLIRAATGGTTGRLSLRLGETWVPDRQWQDFPLVALGWWLGELVRPLSALGSSARCRFMEGPFAFRVVRNAGGWFVALVEGNREQPEVQVDGEALVRSMSEAAKRLLAECDRRGWADTDIDTLRVANETVIGYRTV